jgi:hypothetical protein
VRGDIHGSYQSSKAIIINIKQRAGSFGSLADSNVRRPHPDELTQLLHHPQNRIRLDLGISDRPDNFHPLDTHNLHHLLGVFNPDSDHSTFQLILCHVGRMLPNHVNFQNRGQIVVAIVPDIVQVDEESP